MKFKKSIALLLLLATLMLTSCDLILNLTVDGTVENPSEEDTTDAPEPIYEEKGTLYSEESEMLVLYADWNAVSYNGKTAEVEIKLGISCYGISTGKHDLVVTVNGETQTYTTRAIESKVNEKKKFNFVTFTFDAPLTKQYRGLLDISAVWDYDGIYNGQQINALTAAAKITFPGGEIIEDTDDSTDTSEPSTTDKPTVDEDPPLYKEEGIIYSTESQWLVLFAKWSAVSKDGKTATIKVQTGIDYYSLRTNSHNLTVTVNGESQSYKTPSILDTVNGKKTNNFVLHEFEVELEGNSPYVLDISAVWDFNDDDGYGNQLDDLTAAARISFPGGTVIDPTSDAQQEISPSAQNEESETLIP